MTLDQLDDVTELARRLEPHLSAPPIEDIRRASIDRRHVSQQRNFIVVCVVVVTFLGGLLLTQRDADIPGGLAVRPTLESDPSDQPVRPTTIPDATGDEGFRPEPDDFRQGEPVRPSTIPEVTTSEPESFGGLDVVEVPDVSGFALGDALDALDIAGFPAGELLGSGDASCPVAGTNPWAGSEAPIGTEVDIFLTECDPSSIPEIRTIPDLGDLPFDEGQIELFGLSFRTERIDEAHPTVEPGHIIRTEPATGAELLEGEGVTVVVSTGLET